MMHRIVTWAKEHPYLAVGIGVGLLLLIYYLFFRSSPAPAQDTTGLANYYAAEAASAQTAGAVQQAQLAYNANTNQVNATAKVQSDYIDALKSIALGSQQVQETANTQQYGLDTLQAGYGYNLGNNYINAMADLGRRTIASNTDVATLNSNNALKLGSLASNNALAASLANSQASVDTAAIGSQTAEDLSIMQTYQAAFPVEAATGTPISWGQVFYSPPGTAVNPFQLPRL